LKVPIEESESKRRSDESQLTRNRNNSTVTKRPEILPETCPKSRFYFLERLAPCRLSQVPISRLEAQISRAIPKEQLGPSSISAIPGVWLGTTPTPKPASPLPSVEEAAVRTVGRPLLTVASGQTMSSSETLTQKWLRQNIAAYNDGNRVFADVDATLSLYPTLRPKTDVYSSVTCLERSLTVRSSLPLPPYSL
jgi:hypothetical protein